MSRLSSSGCRAGASLSRLERFSTFLLSAALAGALAGCVSPSPGPVSAPAPARQPRVGPAAEEEGRAFLLMISDRRFYEPFTVRRLLIGEPGLRAELALALGRIGHPDGRGVLEALLEDRRPEVRREAAFALGLLGAAADPVPLKAALVDPDREVGVRAVEALARAGRPLGEVAAALARLDAGERWQRLLPALFRFRPEEIQAVALEALASGGGPQPPPELRARAAYALARRAPGGAADALRELLGDADPWVRGWAARGLAMAGDRGDLARLAPLLEESAAGPVIQALRAARALIASGRAAPPADWLPALERLIDDERAGVRLTAIEAAAGWLRDEALSRALLRHARGGSRRARELALLALTAGRDPRAADLIAEFARDADPILRARAAEAAGELGARAVLERLRADGEPVVRLAALAALLQAGGDGAAATAGSGLADDDPAVQASALQWLAENPVLPVDRLRAPLVESGNRYMVDVGLNGVDALLARAREEARERGVIVAILEEIGAGWDYPVRRRAAAALGALERPVPPRGEFETGRGIRDYRELVRRIGAPRYAELETRHGTLLLKLDCPVAPLTCENFLQLANQGFYDGTTFHRVVPDFVVQAGDPRGDGWGGPGYTIRDENSRLPYGRGAVGMALSGPDTGGSQFFITLSPQPHLEGEFTVFGSVAEGNPLLDRIEQGDRILRLAESR